MPSYVCVYLYVCMTFILILYIIQDTISGFKKIIDGESWKSPSLLTSPSFPPCLCASIFSPFPLSSLHSTPSIFCSPGELDDIPEAAFYMVGGIEEAVSNAEQLAAQHK